MGNLFDTEDGRVYEFNNGMSLSEDKDIDLYLRIVELNPHMNILYPYDDIGFGNLYSDCFSETTRFCISTGQWYIYETSRWFIDKGNVKAQLKLQNLLTLLRLYIDDIKDKIDPDIYKNYKAYINKCSSNNKQESILKSARPNLAIEITDFDTNPYLLNTPYGTYDLSTLSWREPRPADMITLSTSARRQLENLVIAKAHRWEEFIDEIMSGDKEKAHFLQKALGYSLLGMNTEECMFIAYGATTRNGKGTLFNSIAKALGDYGDTISSSLITESRYKDKDYSAPDPMLANTVGKRYLTFSETASKAPLDSTAIKSLTGQDPKRARNLYSDPFTFTPQFTMWLSTNFLPVVKDDTVFTSDRIWVIEFNKHFDENTRDTSLKHLFLEEDMQRVILTWLIEGYIFYTKEGLNIPKCVKDATKKYQESCDRVYCFTLECLEKDIGNRISNQVMYSKYKEWCADGEREYKPLGTTSFYNALERFYPKYYSHGVRGFEDVKFRE